MRTTIIYLAILYLFPQCNDSKWETIAGHGISEEPKAIDEAIYFESEGTGAVGGNMLIKDAKATNDFKMAEKPMLYLTDDGGKNWTMIHFDSTINGSIRNIYLHLDTLICLYVALLNVTRADSTIFLSLDKGHTFQIMEDTSTLRPIISGRLKNNKAQISDDRFEMNGVRYSIKESYKNRDASVLICRGPKTLTDYYFVSFDNEISWSFLHKDFGDSREKYLLGNKFLYRYYFPFGLQRLRLK